MIAYMPSLQPALAKQSKRLRHLRIALGFPKAVDFANFLGISKARWTNFENGYPLSLEVSILMCERIPGLTLDYIYFGRVGGLPIKLTRHLEKSQ